MSCKNGLQRSDDACRSGSGKRRNFHVPREVINYQLVGYAIELKEVREEWPHTFSGCLAATVESCSLEDDALPHLEKVLKLLDHLSILLPISVGDVGVSEGILRIFPHAVQQRTDLSVVGLG